MSHMHWNSYQSLRDAAARMLCSVTACYVLVTYAAQKAREMIVKASLQCTVFKTYHMQSISLCHENAFGDSIILMTS